ncbi:MAG TPA: hypothetical protein VMW28_09015 [Pelolinea sp.]|nr:hypothetical protein [Pelolinea sp.]
MKVWIIITAMVIIFLAAIITLRLANRKSEAVNQSGNFFIPDLMPDNGVNVPVLETFAGIKGLGNLTFAQNNFRPRFLLFNDHMEFKVLFSRKAFYSEVSFMMGISQRYFNRMRFNFEDKLLTFTAALANQREFDQVTQFLESKGVSIDKRV